MLGRPFLGSPEGMDVWWVIWQTHASWLLLDLSARSGPSAHTNPNGSIERSLMSSRRAFERNETCSTGFQGALAAIRNREDFMM